MAWKKENYSKTEGLKRTLKNIAATWGIPAVIYFLNNATEWLPTEWYPVLLPIIGGISYFLKNRFENK